MLNPQQQQAVHCIDRPLLVLAGAGCGKTKVITEKIAHLVATGHCQAEQIYAITFTNKAAREMSQRATALFAQGEQVNISTFHALGLNILQQEIQDSPYRRGFSILDSGEVHKIIKQLLPQGIKKELANNLQWQISSWKNAAITPPDAQSSVPMAIDLYHRYSEHLQQLNALDFDDLIMQPLQLLQQNPSIKQRWQQAIGYLLVDEYQDTNAAQYQLLKLLMGQASHLTCVGDDDQSIYGWRGAQPENLQLLQQDFPRLKVQKLEQNYRSSSTILNAANAVIDHNPHPFQKKIWSNLGTGKAIQVTAYPSPEQEAEQIATQIHHQHRYKNQAFSQFAILYRSNRQAKILEQVLRTKNLPYQLSGGKSFFDYSEIKDMLAYLRLLANPQDNSAFLRIINTPRRGLGIQTVKQITHQASQTHRSFFATAQTEQLRSALNADTQTKLDRFCQLINSHQKTKNNAGKTVNSLFQQLDYVNYVNLTADNRSAKINKVKLVTDFLKWIAAICDKQQPDLETLINYLSLQTDRETDDQQQDNIQLMTLHAAKGLEFSQVFLIGVEEGILPHHNSISHHQQENQQGIEEERRLMYVGMTRAMHRLHISYAQKRPKQQSNLGGASRFIKEIPAQLSSDHSQQLEQQRKTKLAKQFAAMQDLISRS